MLTPIPLPRAPEAAASLLSDALAGIAEESGSVSRDAAVGAFRRHLARIQSYVQHAFEHEQITGLQAARLLGALIDGVAGLVWSQGGTTKVAFDFSVTEGLITKIEMIADPEVLEEMSIENLRRTNDD